MDKQGKVQPKQDILLDTNILQYSGDKYASIVFVPYLQELLGRGFGLAISQISIYELLKGASVKMEREMLPILNLFQQYFITDQVLLAAAQLDTIYALEKLFSKQIEDCDKFIAATSILTGSLILTANARDFPWPYFQEVERAPMIYKEKRSRSRSILVSLLSPDITVINQRFSERPSQ